MLQDVPEAPFETILELLSRNSSNVTERLNRAFPKTILYKSAPKNAGKSMDHKRSLDLSPQRLEAISAADPELMRDAGKMLEEPLAFYKEYQEIIGTKLLPALAQVIGSENVLQDMHFHYRMLDYYPTMKSSSTSTSSTNGTAARRLAAHRDFGFMTMIQATHPGLQIRLETGKRPKWMDLPPIPKGSAILMFGWCAKVRSNGRIPAVLHRVTQHSLASSVAPQQDQGKGQEQEQAQHQYRNRVSAVLFVNPTQMDTSLEPVLKDPTTETLQYIPGVAVGELSERLAKSKLENDVDQWLKYKPPRAKTTNTKFWNKLWRPKKMASGAAAAAAAW